MLGNAHFINDILHVIKLVINISIKRLIFIFFKNLPFKKASEIHLCITEEDLQLAVCLIKNPNSTNIKDQHAPELCSFSYIDKVASEVRERTYKIRALLFEKTLNTKFFNSSASILLIGPPGCGKTFIGKKIAMDFKLSYMYIKTPQILSKYVGEAEKYLNKIFLEAGRNNPSLLFFDEIDAIAISRNLENGNNNKIVQQLLLELDELNFFKKIFIVGATNLIEVIDLAILRKGRFNKKFLIPFPSNKNKINIIRNQTSNKFLSNCLDLKIVTNKYFSIHVSSADIKELLNQTINTGIFKYKIYCKMIYKNKIFIVVKNNINITKITILINILI
mmetsp:Transcript_3287/g.6387  ORF Transcript_3287/g.6387 Transcript_3287/m.6387 type:complete len:334 (+) Transcript_3287:664-1665(+)